jgi:RIO kinase 1
LTRRIGKRKRQERGVYAFKEREKVDSGIFNERAMVYLSKFFNRGVISRLGFITARGKEADLYLAEPGDAEVVRGAKFVVLKFFRIETSSFYKMNDYIVGDPRFGRMTRSKSSVVMTWCRKEYGNLEIARGAGVSAPMPYMFNGSVLAMEFIGSDEGVPAPMLKHTELDDPEHVLDSVIRQVRRLYGSELVHADLSEYNVLIKEGEPYLIDFGQAVVLKHPNATMFLRRDISNVLQYFSKRYGISRNYDEVYEYVTAAKAGSGGIKDNKD